MKVTLPDTDCIEGKTHKLFLLATFLDLSGKIKLSRAVRNKAKLLWCDSSQGASYKGFLSTIAIREVRSREQRMPLTLPPYR